MAHQATVRWDDGSGDLHEELTDTPTQVVARLAEQFAGEVPGLQVVRPSLEDVYLSMISADPTTRLDEEAAR